MPAPEQISLVARVRAAVEREISAIEQSLDVPDGARPPSPDAARSLAALVKTLRELNTLEQASEGVPDADEKENQFRDLDEFRRELLARLARLRAGGDSDS